MKNSTQRLLPTLKWMYLLIACFVVFILNSCSSSREVQFNLSMSAPHKDGSFDISMVSFIGHDTFDFGGSRIFYKQLRYLTSHGDSLNIEIWTPPTPVDSSRLVVLLNGFEGKAIFLYSLAIEATRKGSVVMIANHRGYDLNASSHKDYGTLEGRDVIDALNVYEKNLRAPVTFKVYGVSLGAVLALNILLYDPRAKAAALEAMMLDQLALAPTYMKPSEHDTLQALLRVNASNNLVSSPQAIFEANTITKPLLVIWGKEDKLVSLTERTQLKTLIQQKAKNVDFIEVEGGGHNIRYGFPLSKEKALKLNADIVDFLRQH